MTQKSNYVWTLLLLATAACTSPLATPPPPPPPALLDDGREGEEKPLSTVQELDEQTRLTLTQPLAWTQEEKLVAKKGVTTDSPAQEQQAHTLLILKNDINAMKIQYKEALAEQKKQWEKHGKDIVDLDTEEILTNEHQGHCMEHIIQQEQENIRLLIQQEQENTQLQNRILRTWGDDILGMTIVMENGDDMMKPRTAGNKKYKAQRTPD